MKAEITESKTKQTKFEYIFPGEVFEYFGVLYLKADTSLPLNERYSAVCLKTGTTIRLLDDSDVVVLIQTQEAKFEREENSEV